MIVYGFPKNAILENETEVSTNAHDPQPSSVSINDSQEPTTSTAQNIEDSQSAPIQIAPTLKGKGKGKTSKNKNLQILASAVNEVRKVHDSLRSSNDIITTPVGAQSANSAFGSYVALMLDKMSFEQSLLAQSEIQAILVRFLIPPSTSNTSNASTPSVMTPRPQREQHNVYVPETQDASQLVLQNDVVYIQETQDPSQSILQTDGNVETQDVSQFYLQSEVDDQETQEATQSILSQAWNSKNI
ncbi:unnamed protein product [Parnassius apollo]|uniref:(apollo) hypothetical protein n=1 Tax=Parnassius apollo TaxID=110799 RepID=A0A8S3XH91_PARAO|nr:unnamed protein product [Parnassius apollo]